MVWTLSVIMCLVEVSIFYLLGLNLTKPLQELTHAMAVVDPAIMDKRLTKTKRVDEIGVLHNSFRAMLEKLKKTEVERQRAMISLVQTEKLAIVGKLVAGVAHEINNPLAAIESCLYNLKQIESWRNNSDLAILQQARKQIENIVLQLLDFSRAGQLFLEEVQSDSFFTEMASLAEMAIKKKHVILKKHDLCDPPQLLTIDISKITQVALDIVSNAADASPPEGTIELSAYTENEAYCLAIKDNGAGIPNHLSEKIFEPFYTMKSGKGNGIGLAISKNIVDMHCGSIVLDSKPGETIFTVVLPLNRGEYDVRFENSRC